jgi:iron complex transport system substrate-binding protein
VACIEWLDPLMVAGNWIPELVELAGGEPILCESGKHSPWITWEDLVQHDADYLVIMPCGFDIKRSTDELHLLADHPAWPHLKAVKNQRVFLTDGNQYFNRSGPRVVESCEILAEILRPDQTNSVHRGIGWQPLSFG